MEGDHAVMRMSRGQENAYDFSLISLPNSYPASVQQVPTLIMKSKVNGKRMGVMKTADNLSVKKMGTATLKYKFSNNISSPSPTPHYENQ